MKKIKRERHIFYPPGRELHQSIRPITSFRVQVRPDRLLMGLACVGLFLVVGFAGYFGAMIGQVPTQTGAGLAIASSIPLACGVLLIMRWLNERHRAERCVYEDELSLTDVAVLIQARTSPELDERSRELITEFLNTNHPGWSFDGSEGGSRQAGV